jgi:hypothetical protein
MTRMTRPTSSRTIATSSWRRLAASLIALALLAVLTLSLAGAADAKGSAPGAQPGGAPKLYQPSGHGTALTHGVVDLSKLPTITPHAVTSVQATPLPGPDALTPAQRQAYNDRAQQARTTANASI